MTQSVHTGASSWKDVNIGFTRRGRLAMSDYGDSLIRDNLVP